MKDQLISFETSKLAKEKGFDIKVPNVWYNNGVSKCRIVTSDTLFDTEYYASTQSLLQRWLRDVHNLSVCISFRKVDGKKVDGINSVYYDVFIYYLTGGDAWKKIHMSEISDVYEEALEKGLQEALKLITNEQDSTK